VRAWQVTVRQRELAMRLRELRGGLGLTVEEVVVAALFPDQDQQDRNRGTPR
jgi:hypothetical protein